MAIMQALALLAGGAAGYARRQKDNKDEARQAEDDAFRREQRQRQRIDWQRQDKQWQDEQAEKDAVKAAAAPTTVDDTPVAPPIGSRDEPRAPEDQGIRAAGQTFTDRASADAAAAEYNAPPARMRRAAGAVSDPVRAGQLEASAQTAETGAMALRAAKLKEADDAYNRQLIASVTDFATLEQFVNDTKGDGRGGDLKIKIQPSADGKMVQVLKLNPDGTTAPTPFSFQNNTEGVQQAVGIIGMKLSPTDKLAHLQATAKTAEDARRWGLEYDLKKQDSENRGKREDRMARAAERQAAAAEHTASLAETKAKAAAAPGGLTLADLKDGHKTIATTLNADYKTQIDNAADEKTSKAIKTTREAEIADVQRIYTGAMQAGFALTPEQAIVAYRTGQKRTGNVQGPDGKPMKVNGVVYGGKFIPMAEEPGTVPPAAAPAPAPTARAASAPAQAAPAATPTAAPVAAPAGAPPPPVGATGDPALKQVMAEKAAKLDAAEQALAQVRAEGAAAMQSGDQRAVATYTQRIAAAQRARDAIAAELGR